MQNGNFNQFMLADFRKTYVFGLKELAKREKVSCWGKITREGYNNKGYPCWVVESNGSERLIQKDKFQKTWFKVSQECPEDAKNDAKSVFDHYFNEDGTLKRKKPTKSAATASRATASGSTASGSTASGASE